ncbi:MAG TPA: amidohydrolase family protein [Thermoanaerobaculia bacterium]|nr:amidohydrolase family protein [Thermoanaerobaculia bacterium]
MPSKIRKLVPWAVAIVLAAGLGLVGRAATTPAGGSMSIEDYEPKSTLHVPEHHPQRAKYPFIDVHNHQDRDQSAAEVAKLVSDMDSLGMRVMVNLSGSQGAEFDKGYRNLKGRYPDRFVIFANLDYDGISSPGWTAKAVAQLVRDHDHGAQGLKIFKDLGLSVTDTNGKRVAVDDPRLDPIWAKCGELGIPVLIHSAEPRSFFDPWDRYNERWLELKQFPYRARPPEKYPSWETIIGEQHRMFAKHPETKFIDAHLGWLGGDLARLGQLFDRLPNVYTEIGAVLAELGRQPRFARQWFIRYQDRVMFGKDIWEPSEYLVYFRVLETDDEYFDYYRKRHAFWKMYGMNLPDEVLRKLYYANALKVIPGIDPSPFPK